MSRRKKPKRDLHIKRRTDPGAPPGTVVADPLQPMPEVHAYAYSSDILMSSAQRAKTLALPMYIRRLSSSPPACVSKQPVM